MRTMVIVFFLLLGGGKLALWFASMNQTIYLQAGEIAHLQARETILCQLRYVAADLGYGDANRIKDPRLTPLDSFIVPRTDKPLWIQADDGMIQVLVDSTFYRVDLYKVSPPSQAPDTSRHFTALPASDSARQGGP